MSSCNFNLFFNISNHKNTRKGFGLAETIVGVAVFVLIATAAYGGFLKVIEGVKVLRVKNAAVNLANEQIEIARNLPYSDVGIVNGIPAGKIPREQNLNRSGIDFNVLTSVRNVDDPFDGQIGQTPNDLSPADYKMLEITITCANCKLEEELNYYARIAPVGLETTGNNGALFVQVVDANGQPVQGADVLIENSSETPAISINETTNNAGMFQLIDASPGDGVYEVTVSKGDNYSTDRTYTIGDALNPNPNIPHANVAAGQVTQLSFAIDELSNLDIYTRDNTCARISNVDFNIAGSKTIGTNVLKYESDKITGGNGFLGIIGLEWDSYALNITDGAYHLAGSSPFLPLQLNPGSEQSIDLILEPKNGRGLLVKVIDDQTDLPISGATVTIDGPGGEQELISERGFFSQTDWSGGSGAENFTGNEDGYFSASDIEIDNPAGQISLSEFSGNYSDSGFLESAIFDTGTTTNFGNIFWNPVDQPILAGNESVKIQMASNQVVTATSTWDFIGPDGTDSSFYTSSGQAIAAENQGDRYIKYKVFLETDDDSVTPAISNISFTFTQDCLPPGQVFFSGLSTGTYDLDITHPDYQDFSTQITINSEWSAYDAILSP